MALERSLPVSPSLAEVFQQKVNRRDFLMVAGGIGGVISISYATRNLDLFQKAPNALLEYEKGFNLVSEGRKNELWEDVVRIILKRMILVTILPMMNDYVRSICMYQNRHCSLLK